MMERIAEKKEKIALFTCMPPVRSGIVAYSKLLIENLSDFYEIDIYCGTPPLQKAKNTFHHTQFLFRHLKLPYEAIIYQLGNHESFSFVYPYLAHYPGITVLHDIVLYQSRAKYLINSGKYKEYEEEMQYCHGYSGKKMAQVSLQYPMPGYSAFLFTMNKLVIEKSLVIGVHTKYFQEQLQFEYPAKKIFQVPMSLDMPAVEDLKRKVRERYTISDKTLLIGSAGFVDQHKGIESIIEVMNSVQKKYNVHFIWLGEDRNNMIQKSIEKIANPEVREKLKKMFTVTGYLQEEDFLSYLRELDIFINLRYPTAGEFSGVLWLALQSGKATVMSDLPHLYEIPEECVLRIKLTKETESLEEALLSLLEYKDQREQLGRRAKEYVSQNFTIAKMVNTYRDMIDEVKKVPRVTISDALLPRHWQSFTLSGLLASLSLEQPESWKNILEHLDLG